MNSNIIVSTCFPFNLRMHIFKISSCPFCVAVSSSFFFTLFVTFHWLSWDPLKSNLISRFHSRKYHQIKRREKKNIAKMSSQCELFLISQELIPGKQFDSIVLCQLKMKKKKNITEFYIIFYVAVDNDLKWCECEWEKT